jgi:hypothetical protein
LIAGDGVLAVRLENLGMKRLVGSFLLTGTAICAFSQAPFTIVRPSEGARVRENVKIDIPAKSIPPGGYVGVFLNDKLIEAVVPPLVGKYYEYTLNTKARHIPDTQPGQTDKLELVLYVDYDEKARVVDRSSVNVTIGNEKNIPIPASGVYLRYNFRQGQQMIYDLTQHIQTSSLTQAQADDADSRAATWDTEGEAFRVGYSVVNTYPGGDGLLCMQVLPTKGRDYADITPAHATSQQRWYEDQMEPVYMRVTPTGHEVYGAITHYFGFEGVPTSGPGELILPLFPLPTLPQKAVHNGDEWPSRFQEGAEVDLGRWWDISSIVEAFPAKGQFVGAEWERNHPCAKIQNVIEAGTESLNKGTKRPYSGDRVSVTETMWFALDTHEILKIDRDVTIDRKVETTGTVGGGFGGPPPGMGGPGGPPRGQGGVPGPSMSGFGGQMTGLGGTTSLKQRPPGSKFGNLGGGMMGGGPPGFGGRNFGGGNAPGAPTSTPTYVRLHMLQTFTLEK